MKKIIEKYGLLTALISIFLVVFIFGGMFSRYMTSQRDVHAQDQITAVYLDMFENATKAEAFTTTGVVKSYLKPLSTTDSFSPELVASYKIFDGSTEIGVVYVVKSFGKFADLIVAYAISLSTDAIIGVMVVSNNETQSPQYYGKLALGDFYDQFSNKPLEDVGFAVDTVAGATMSSKGIEIGMLYAREQYAQDYDFVIPSVVMTLNSLNYNLDPATFATKPYIADVTYGEANTNIVVYLDAAFNYSSMVTGTEPEQDVLGAIKSYASASGLVSTKIKFVSYATESRSLVMTTSGYNGGSPIQITFVLKADFTGIDTFEVLSNESYDEDYNETYTDAAVPYTEETLLNLFKNGQTSFDIDLDGIAGATVTSTAVIDLIEVLNLFIVDQNGGN